MSITALETGLRNKLTGASALVTDLSGTYIYGYRAPQSPPDKYVIFQQQGGPGNENETKHETENLVYTVQGVAFTRAAAASLADKIDAALHKQTLTISGATNFWTAREGWVNYAEEDSAGVTRFHSGGQYRIRTDSS